VSELTTLYTMKWSILYNGISNNSGVVRSPCGQIVSAGQKKKERYVTAAILWYGIGQGDDNAS
jgi:hypothetical protein